MTSSPKVTLFPWDPKSEAHRKCLVKQRVECGWHHEQVETTWATQQLEGKKCIYWIVSYISYYQHRPCNCKSDVYIPSQVLQSDESQATSPEVSQDNNPSPQSMTDLSC